MGVGRVGFTREGPSMPLLLLPPRAASILLPLRCCLSWLGSGAAGTLMQCLINQFIEHSSGSGGEKALGRVEEQNWWYVVACG